TYAITFLSFSRKLYVSRSSGWPNTFLYVGSRSYALYRFGMLLAVTPMFIARRYHFAVAFFHSAPQRGVPAGTGRYPIGRPLLWPTLIVAPPMAPIAVRSN